MATKKINITYWKQSTGLTGQNLTQSNQSKFTRVSKKFYKVTGKTLSKVRLYKASRYGARQVKTEFGARIGSTSIAMFEMLLTGINQQLNDTKTNVDFGSFKVTGYNDFANRGKTDLNLAV
tara:strand:+ start:1893 stop:2255 length:363 start_codon:yes stop_codon:yes gene_type:complete